MQENSSKNTHLSGRLPVHHPDDSLWNSIEGQLDADEKERAYFAALQKLPLHTPDNSLWFAIERRLGGFVYRRAILWTTGIAASLLLMFGIFNSLNNSNPVQKEISQNNNKITVHHPEAAVVSAKNPESDHINNTSSLPYAGQKSVVNHHPASQTTKSSSEIIVAGLAENNATVTNQQIAMNDDPQPVIENTGVEPAGTSDADNTVSILFNGEKPVVIPDYYTNYPEPAPANHPVRSFALGMNYMPEQVTANAGVALMNTFDLGATYSGDMYRVQSSIGLSYNKAEFTYDLAYNQVVEIPVQLPGQRPDTMELVTSNSFSNLTDIEKHQYLTYSLGAGRKLISKGKLSAWLNAGAGIAVKLDKSNTYDETVSKIQHQETHGNIEEIKTNLPSFSSYYFNLHSGIDINYQIFKRLSLSFTPNTRYYLHPVLESENESSDKFSIGFTSGLKFKL